MINLNIDNPINKWYKLSFINQPLFYVFFYRFHITCWENLTTRQGNNAIYLPSHSALYDYRLVYISIHPNDNQYFEELLIELNSAEFNKPTIELTCYYSDQNMPLPVG